jgi:hypothetical protein
MPVSAFACPCIILAYAHDCSFVQSCLSCGLCRWGKVQVGLIGHGAEYERIYDSDMTNDDAFSN